jgi:preprotein translocase subunit SecA
VAARAVEQDIGLGKPKSTNLLTDKSTAIEVNQFQQLLKKISDLENQVASLKKSETREKAKLADAKVSEDSTSSGNSYF